MASKFEFYKPQYNPANLTGQVGGTISSSLLSGYLGELFCIVDAPPPDTEEIVYQYRKLFIKNSWTAVSANTRCWFDAVQHPGQISVALQTGGPGLIANAQTEPVGITDWTSPSNYIDGLNLGTLNVGSSTGLWIREKLENITEPDSFASLRLYIGGIDE